MYVRGVGGTMVQSVRLYQMFMTNGTCVSSTVKASAGNSGSPCRHGRGSPSCFGAVPSAAPGSCRTVSSCTAFSGSASDLGGDVLARTQRRVDVGLPGDDAGDLLGAAVADALELRDPDVLHARHPRPGCRARVVDRGSLHRLQGGVGERTGSLLVLRDLVRGGPGARRDRRPAAWDLCAGLLDVVGAGRPGDVLPPRVGVG